MAELIAIVGESGSGKTTSIRNLNPEEIRNIEKQFKEEDDSKKDNATDNKNENSQAFTGGSATNDTDIDTTASEARFGDVYNVKGIKAKYNGYKVSSDYILDGVFSMNADKGNKYIIVSIVPFIISLVFDLSGIPTIIDTRIPPTKPPI